MKHLEETNKTYFEHMRHAFYYVFQLQIAVLALIVHAFVPFIFITTASDKIEKLFKLMKSKSTEANK
jgi:hypothetical protein